MKMKACYTSLVFSFLFLRTFAIPSSDSAIMATKNPKGWMISTNNSVYQLILTKENEVQQDFLMKVGIAWPVRGAYKSMILQVQKTKR